MRLHHYLLIFLVWTFILFFFFYKTIGYGLVPFPGDLLLSEYSPYKHLSFFGYNPGSIPNKGQYFDVALQLYPWKALVIEELKSGQMPLWNPYNFSGSPLLANNQSSPLYPLSFLYFIFPQHTAWTILVMLQPFLAGLFMFLYTRRIGLGMIASLFSSVSYAFSLYMSVFLEYNTIGHVLSFLPLSLYAFEAYLKHTRWWFLVLFVVSVSASFLAGHLQVAVLSIGVMSLYILYRLILLKKHGAQLFIFPILCITGLLIASIQLVPTLELITNSARVSQDYEFVIEKLLVQPSQLVMMFSPDIFGNPATRNFLPNETYPTKAMYLGFLPLLFAFFSILAFRKNAVTRFFMGVSVIFLIFLTRNPISQLFYMLDLPFISSSSPSNGWFVFVFSTAVLSGFGIEHILTRRRIPYRLLFSFVGVLVVCFGLAIVSAGEYIQYKQFAVQVALMIVGCLTLLLSRVKKISFFLLGSVIIVFTVIDLFYYFQKFNPFSIKESLYPKTSIVTWLDKRTINERVWGIGTAQISPNLHTKFHLHSPIGYDPLYPKLYGQFLHSFETGELQFDFSNQTRSNAGLGDAFSDGALVEDERRLRLLDFLGVKYILSHEKNAHSEKTFPPERFKFIHEGDGFQVYENLRVQDRAYLVFNTIRVADEKSLGEIFYSAEFDPAESVIIYDDITLSSESSPSGTLDLKSYGANRLEYSVETSSDAVLVVTDSFFPGWNAYVDGEPRRVVQVNHAFRGVVVPKGSHSVSFLYQPLSFTIGLYLSIIGIGFVPVLLYYFRRLYA